MRLVGVRQCWVVYIGSVQERSVAKAIASLVLVNLQYCRADCRVLIDHLLDEHEHSALESSAQMELKLRQSFGEGNQNIGGELLLLDEHKMATLEESQLVLEGVSGWVFYQSQNDGVKAIDEIFLFDVESAAFTNFNYLECAK